MKIDHLANGVLSPDPLQVLPEDRIHHVYPTFGKEHSTNSRGKCWCVPMVEFVTEQHGLGEHEITGAIIIHHQDN